MIKYSVLKYEVWKGKANFRDAQIQLVLTWDCFSVEVIFYSKYLSQRVNVPSSDTIIFYHGKKYLNWEQCFSVLYDIFKLLLDYSARKLPTNKVCTASWEAGVLCLRCSCCTTPGLKQGAWVQRSFPSKSEMHGELSSSLSIQRCIGNKLLERFIVRLSTGKRE